MENMPNLPTGTVTFLFTDIEGSTKLAQRHPAAWEVLRERHHDILKSAIESHNGYTWQIIGDAFCAAFHTATDALNTAVQSQIALNKENWGNTPIKVRMGLHTGKAEIQPSGEYLGYLAMSRVQRLMSAAHGGQVLVTLATQQLVREDLPEEVTLRDMGKRRLKDLIHEEHIFQLVISNLPADFPPIKTLDAYRHNLPIQLTSFVGREKEIAAVKRLITGNRLTTLTGPGGTGKTRLSLQVGGDLLDSFPDGVWFVEFAPLADPALLARTVMITLGLREEMGRLLLNTNTLIDYLRGKTALLILDNCEHVVEASAQLAESLLQTCPDLRLLVSSREALDIPGETPYHVPSLSTPNIQLPQSVETVTQYEAVRLFIDRAQTVLPMFMVTNTNASAVAQICSRLDGIPLAIELAAARVKVLKVEQIAERLDDRFRLLTGGRRTALLRHHTLRALIDWSYDLLPAPERALLQRLSVFAGGWTLEAAETVCQGQGIDGYDVLDLLTQLVNKSLVVVDADDGTERRYRFLETIRQYAREKLLEAGEGLDVSDRHLEYFLGMAERADLELRGPKLPEWLKRLEVELDNLRAALAWSLKQNAMVGLRLASALLWFWDGGNYLREGSNWLAQLLSQPETQEHTIVRARALGIRGYLLLWGGYFREAQPILEESVAMCRELGDKPGGAFGLIHLGIAISNGGDSSQGRQRVAESLALYRELGDKFGIAWALTALGGCIGNKASPADVARAFLEEGLPIFRELEFLPGIVHILAHLGQLVLNQGDYRAARPWLEESLAMQRQLGRGGSTGLNLRYLGEVAFQEGDYKLARAYYEEQLSRAEATGNYLYAYGTEIRLGYVALREGDREAARRIFEKFLQRARKAEEQYEVVSALEGFASLAVAQNQPERAARVFAWADAAREASDNTRPPVEQADVDRDLATIHAQLDEPALAMAQAKGRAMTLEQAVAYALEETPS